MGEPITSVVTNNAHRDRGSSHSTQPSVNTNPFASNQSLTNGNLSSNNGDELRAKLRYFFMSPCWKWQFKRRCPWKAWFQMIKILILTTQLILFGIDRQTHVIFLSESNITFHHLFIRNWDASDEALPYPRASGDFALYTKQDLMDSINYAIHQFNHLRNLSLGEFDYHDQKNQTGNMITLCINRFQTCHINASSHTYELDIQTEDVCFDFHATDYFNVEEYLLDIHNETINYCGLNLLTLEFSIHAIQLKNQKPFSLPDCYLFLIKIIFDNNARTGKIRQRLDSQAEFRICHSKIIDPDSHLTLVRRNFFIAFDLIVLFITILSFILCVRSLWSGHKLCQEIRLYYSKERTEESPLTWNDLQIFYSFWYFLMIITDVMVIPGTIIKLKILFKITDDYDAPGLLLGISSLFSWIGILRYLFFFRKYNLLFLTIEKALPLIIRFVLCTMIIFCGFMFCGWIVLGPYHSKFQSLSSTSDTMFSLINADDMYATFANLETESFYIWLFSQIYLLSFLSLFIYVVLSVFISLILDGYETVKQYNTEGFPKSRLRKFSEENIPEWSGPEDWQGISLAVASRAVCFPCCFKSPPELRNMTTRDLFVTQHSSGSI